MLGRRRRRKRTPPPPPPEQEEPCSPVPEEPPPVVSVITGWCSLDFGLPTLRGLELESFLLHARNKHFTQPSFDFFSLEYVQKYVQNVLDSLTVNKT